MSQHEASHGERLIWYRKDLTARVTALALLPLSWLYCLLVSLKGICYRSGLCKSRNFDVPVVIVGNITVGGTGKTPFLVALAKRLVEKGYRPGIVSRGYGGNFTGVYELGENDDPAVCGDEPLLIQQSTGLPVVLCADRAAAVDKLLSAHDCNIVLSDDGLQHLRLGRRLEIVIVDAARMFGNGFCLPAGPLREPRSRLSLVDLVVYHETGHEYAPGSEPGLSFCLQGTALRSLLNDEERPLQDFVRASQADVNSAPGQLHAIAGIGNPSRFFRQLVSEGLGPECHAFADHHQYSAADFQGWAHETIIMTEKDAVKCRQLAKQGVLTDAWYLPVQARFSARLDSELERLLTSVSQP